MDYSLRYLNPVLTDRVNHLLEKTYGVQPHPPLLFKTMTHNQYRGELEEFEERLMKLNKFNILIKNVPRFAESAATKTRVKVTYVALRDTFNQFGEVRKIEVFNGNVYIGFHKKSHATSTHDQINNMQMGDNIIKTKVI
jgi:hypothetical protein